MIDRISFTDPVQHRLNANGWANGLTQLQQLDIDVASQETGVLQPGRTIKIDLSKAVFADFAILGRILILAVVLADRGIDLLVRMPDDKISPDEQEMLIASEKEIARNARFGFIARLCRQRENCRIFLHQSGFSDALQTGPLAGKVRFDEDDEGLPLGEGNVPTGTFDPNSQERYHPPQRLRRVVPYRWLQAKSGGQDSQLPDLSGIEQSLDKMGLTSYDAAAITQGILREALENVAAHSGATGPAYALLGAILVQPSIYKPRLQDFDGHLETFAKWASGVDSPLLRLFVGDAGRGIQPSLDNARSPDHLAVEQAIIAALDYHPPSPDSTTGPHGLWKVKEMVRSFQGSVVIISGPAIAGYVFEPHEHQVRPRSAYWLSGTVVECNLLAGAERDTEPVAGSGSPPEASSPPDIRCVPALLRSGLGLDPNDITEIAEALLEPDENPTAGVVISVEMRPGDASPTDWDIQQAIHQIHDRAKYAITDAMIAVVFTGVSWRLLELAVIDLNLQLGIEDRSEGAPLVTSMLIMTADGRHYWVGGSPNFRKVFQQLSHSGSPLRLTAVSKLLEPAEARQLVEAGQSLRRILTVESGMVRLRFQPHDAISALTDHFRRHLATVATEQRSYGKDGEVFVAPSLREVDRWIDIRGALHTAKCTRIAGFLMAAGAQTLIAAPSGSIPEFRVVRVGALEEELASTFVLSLTGNEREVSFEELETLQNIRPDAPRGVVVLCTGIVSNGAAIRRTVRELWHLGFPDVAVAAIIDARDLTRTIDHTKEDADNLVVYDKKVPFFSLAAVSVAMAETDRRPEDRIFIDPLICQPVPANYPRARTFMLQSHYKDAIRRSDACRLGHIRRSGRRHYPAYIDTAKLFADADWSRQVISAMMKRIEDDQATAGLGQADQKSRVCIIYPGEPNEDLAYVAQRLLGAMRAGPLLKQRMASLDPVPVPRAVANGEWFFPREIQLPKNAQHIVAIDSLSKTGTTLRHLVRLAAQPQVKFISAFSLVNGMTDLEALALQGIASVRARACDDNGKWSETIVPVNVRYLVRTAVGSKDDASCAQCALRSSYASLPTMPELLERHRDWLLRMLGTRSRESVYADTLSDLFGMAVKQDDCIEYLVWRSFLAEATLDTEIRLKVVDKISELADKCCSDDMDDDLLRRRDALVRVLAAELDRLPAAPLFFTSVRRKVMKILWSLVEAPRTYAIDQALRVQAVAVLSRGDVQGFSEEYARLVRDSSDNELVLRQVLIEAVRLITRRSGLPDWSNTLANQISMLSQEVHMLPESGGSSGARPELAEGLDYLAALMEDERGTAF